IATTIPIKARVTLVLVPDVRSSVYLWPGLKTAFRSMSVGPAFPVPVGPGGVRYDLACSTPSLVAPGFSPAGAPTPRPGPAARLVLDSPAMTRTTIGMLALGI